MKTIRLEVFGWRGWEIELDDRYVMTRVLFAVADPSTWKKRFLAWYLWTADMGRHTPKFDDDAAAISSSQKPTYKIDRRDFGSAIANPTLNDYAGIYVSRLAGGLANNPSNKGFLPPRAATLSMIDHDGTTTCQIRNMMDLDGRQVWLDFDLVKTRDRRTMNVQKDGHVWFFGVEPFSVEALKRGIRGPTQMTRGADPEFLAM